MKFELVFEAEEFDISYGEQGRELSCFIPEGMSWRQLNYGQGEGQVEIDGNEWGFYYSDSGGICVVLHKGEAQHGSALEFVEKVKDKIFGERSKFCKVLLVE